MSYWVSSFILILIIDTVPDFEGQLTIVPQNYFDSIYYKSALL